MQRERRTFPRARAEALALRIGLLGEVHLDGVLAAVEAEPAAPVPAKRGQSDSAGLPQHGERVDRDPWIHGASCSCRPSPRKSLPSAMVCETLYSGSRLESAVPPGAFGSSKSSASWQRFVAEQPEARREP